MSQPANPVLVDRNNIVNINVGILGHVDSGKTSLVKALSTSLSTAALDKNPQSQQRGITLDLGFSAFTLPLPTRLNALVNSDVDAIQFTLVDCPGHASLIRTIIGGAQIVDMILLVVDANKGIQTQTAECIVIGEITTDTLIIVLNKIDSLPEDERAIRLEKMITRLTKLFSNTKFKNPTIVCTAASVGGEKVASVGASQAAATSKSGTSSIPKLQSTGIDSLVEVIKDKVIIPTRNIHCPFYYAIDHCFAIKGHGTVLTGTVLSGRVNIADTIEIPELQLQRKVKSMQMFRKAVRCAGQGDRVALCVTNVDPTLIERTVAASPGSVPLLSSVVCLVKKIRFFKHPCKSNCKYHISIGHTTVVANVIFFGAKEFVSHQAESSENQVDSSITSNSIASEAFSAEKDARATTKFTASSTSADFFSSLHSISNSFPTDEFDINQEFEHQEELVGSVDSAYGNEPMQWAVLHLQKPVYCPLGSLIIGSRLDADTSEEAGLEQHCRLAFFGPVRSALPKDDANIKIFNWRSKYAEVHKILEEKQGRCFELIGSKLVSDTGLLQPFIGLRIVTAGGDVGVISGPYGSGGKFKVKFSAGATVTVNSELTLRFKRFVHDKLKTMQQTNVQPDTEVVVMPSEVPAASPADPATKQTESIERSDRATASVSVAPNEPKSKTNVVVHLNASAKASTYISTTKPAISTPPVVVDQIAKPASLTDVDVARPQVMIVSSPRQSAELSSRKQAVKSGSTDDGTVNYNYKPVPLQLPAMLNMTGMRRIATKVNAPNLRAKAATTHASSSNALATTNAWYQKNNSSNLNQSDKPIKNSKQITAAATVSLSSSTRIPEWGPHHSVRPIASNNDRRSSSAPRFHSSTPSANNNTATASNSSDRSLVNTMPVKLLVRSSIGNIPVNTRGSSNSNTNESATSSGANNGCCAQGASRSGRVESVKCMRESQQLQQQEGEGPQACGEIEFVIIVAGAFRMEENIRDWTGCKASHVETGLIGELIGPFAKMGKCKVRFRAKFDDNQLVPAVHSIIHIAIIT